MVGKLHPTGTLTFLFTDIEGSTRLWETHPEQMKLAFSRQEQILRQGIATHQGYPYKMIGDAFQAAFATALEALNAAIDIQFRLTAEDWGDTPIRIRMALHTGATEERGDDYVGPVLNRVSRLLATGHGGQILLTQATTELVVDQLPPGISLKDLGAHHLKDLVRPEHIFQVVAPCLPVDFPSLKTIDALPNNLPLQLTSFIGREKEMSDLRSLLTRKETRMVTLTGSGGTGKTRLSLQLAADLLDKFPDGAWLVELAPVTDPDLVPKQIATLLDIPESAEKALTTSLTDFLRSKKMLLILDNCEHLVEACASLANTLLRACPELLILASSRELIGIGGEIPFQVPSLSTPDLRNLPALENLEKYEAVRLFVERAQTVSPGFSLTKANSAYVAQVVKRLDGIPLAIELAAARVRLLSPAQIADRLDDAFRLLTGGSRAVLPRHQTLRALIDWSHDLLSSQERILLRRLSVFSGGWSLEAAEAVCADDIDLSAWDVLDVLTQLVDKSLAFYYEETSNEARYRMMETIRQYAHEKLVASGESESVRNRHLAYFLNLAETGEPFLRSREQVLWLDRIESGVDNLRLALEWALEKNLDAELRLAAALMWFWHIRGLSSEGIQWLSLGLSKEGATGEISPGATQPMVRAKALLTLGALQSQHGHRGRVVPILEESLALYQSMGPEGRAGAANAYRWLATAGHRKRDHARASSLARQAMSLFRELGDRFGLSECMSILIDETTNPTERIKGYLDILAVKRDIGDVDGIAFALQILSQEAFLAGDYENASAWLDESLERFREVGNRRFAAADLYQKATICWAQGDYSQAAQWIEEALVASRDSADNQQMITNVLRKGDIAFAMGNVEDAVQSYTDGLRQAQETGDRRLAGVALAELGTTDWLGGKDKQAEERWESALSIAHETHFRWLIYSVQVRQGKKALWSGDLPLAEILLKKSLKFMIEMDDWVNVAYILDACASLALQQHNNELSIRLFGAAENHFRLGINALPKRERERSLQDKAELRAALGEERFTAGWQEGETLTQEQIKELVIH